MIKIEYVIKGTEDLNLYCIDNKSLCDYNNPTQLLKEVFGKHRLVYTTGHAFKLTINRQEYLGTFKGGN